jgi:hypothetical protein
MNKIILNLKKKRDEIVFVLGLIATVWGAYSSIHIIVKAEGQEIKREVGEIRNIDMNHLNQRFDRIEKRFDKLEDIIRSSK